MRHSSLDKPPIAKKLGKGYTYMLAFTILASLFSHKYEVSLAATSTSVNFNIVPKISTQYESLAIFLPHLLFLILVLGGDTDKLAILIGKFLLRDK